jgi:hypothetical protein
MKFPHDAIVAAFKQIGCGFREVPRSLHAGYIRYWVAIYGNFYSAQRRRLIGGRAIERAQMLNTGSYLVVPCRDPSYKGWSPVGLAYDCRCKQLPDLTAASQYIDAFISPKDLKWTLLYGHEVDVFGGPHFSEADWGLFNPSSDDI